MQLPPAFRALMLLAGVTLAACSPPDSANAATAGATTVATIPAAATNSDTISERADRGRIMGEASAPVWFIIASDFQCPYCREWHDESFASLVKDYVRTGKLRVAYVNFPLSIHPNAMPSAEAAMCASAQGKFWQMHDALFESQAKWADQPNPLQTFDSLAQRAGVAMPAWRQCMARHLAEPIVRADHDRIAAAKINSTPNFFVGDQLVAGVKPYAELRQVIDAALAKARPAQAKPPTL
jgi:protein-disulfide isomerase